MGSLFPLLLGKTYVFDRAYNDLSFWHKIMQSESHFVTRLKGTTYCRIVEHRVQQEKSEECLVLLDGFYKPTKSTFSQHKEMPKDIKLRHIIYRDTATKKVFHFVTSDFESPATAYRRYL